MTYDSRPDARAHIQKVQHRLREVIAELGHRLLHHDADKLKPGIVRDTADAFPPALYMTAPYNSREYWQYRDQMAPGLDAHYAANRHHPEHFADGVLGMNLLDLVEMLADWRVAVGNYPGGSLDSSITQNAERFGYGQEIETLLRNTARDMDWL